MNKNAQYLSIVAGNDFELTAKISSYDVDNSAYTDFDLTGCSQLCLFLVAVTGGRRYKLPITISGNSLTTQIDGSMLNVGLYGLELLFEDAESKSKRSYEPALIKIVRTNAEATFSNAEFDSEDDCRLHITVQTNTSFVTIGAPTADTEISATSYNAVSNAVVSSAINNLQTQIDHIGSEILDPSSVYTKEETEALVDTMIDAQEMEDYVSYVTSYYTTTEQFDNSYNSLSERISAIEDNPVDLSSYVSKDYLSQQAYITTQDVSSMGYATQAYVDEKVAAVDVTEQLADYVSKSELSAASYLQSDDLNGLATESYVVDKINAITPTDISGLVSYEFLTAQAYLQSDDISDVVRDSDLANAGYITESDVAQMGYITTQDVSAMGYVSESVLSNAGYITETALDAALSSYAQLADLISNERVVSTALNSLADRIEVIEGDYVSDTELDEALLPYATESYVAEKIDALAPSDLNEYVSKEFLSQQGYITAQDVSEQGYITAQDVSAMGYATTQYVTQQITNDLSSYVSRSELSAASYLQSDALNGLATESYVVEKIEAIAPTDITGLVSYEFLSSQSYLQAEAISDVVRDSDLASAGYLTESDVAAMGYLTESDLAGAGYITETDLAGAGYVTTTELSSAGYVTTTELSSAGYVTATEISNAGYVTATEISNAGYVTATEISNAGYVTTTELSNAGYITESDVSAMGYITESDVSAMGYITESDVSAMGYITAEDVAEMGYVTTTNLNTTLSSYVKVSDMEDNEQVISTALNTLSDRIDDLEGADFATKSYVDEKISGITPTDLSSYVSKTELNAAGYITESDVAQMGYITANDVAAMGYLTDSDLADYVTDSDLANAGYVTTTALDTALSSYVTDTDLSNASYVTNTALNTTLSSYTTKADVPYKFVVISYADYTALPTKDPNTFYCIPE